MTEIPAYRITLGEIMEQAQVFASAYALVGGRFDDGSKLRQSQDEKDSLEVMVGMLVSDAILAERERCLAEFALAAFAVSKTIRGEVSAHPSSPSVEMEKTA